MEIEKFDLPLFPLVPLGGGRFGVPIIFVPALGTSWDVIRIGRNLDRGLLLGIVWARCLVIWNIPDIAWGGGRTLGKTHPPLPHPEIIDPKLADLPVSFTEAQPWVRAFECLAEMLFSLIAEVCEIFKCLTAVMDIVPIRCEISVKRCPDVF